MTSDHSEAFVLADIVEVLDSRGRDVRYSEGWDGGNKIYSDARTLAVVACLPRRRTGQ